MKIVICGGGIAGLACAIALRREGHNVTILERGAKTSEFGAALSLHHNTVPILNSWGFDFGRAKGVVQRATRICRGDTLEQLREIAMEAPVSKDCRRYAMLRQHFIQELLRLATQATGNGVPAEMVYNAEVASLDETKGTVLLADQRVYQGDLLVVATGVHSTAPAYVNGDTCPEKWTRMTVVRFLVKTEDLAIDPTTHDLVSAGPGMVHARRSPSGRVMVQYDAAQGTMQNWALFTFSDHHSSVNREDSRFSTSRSQVKEQMDGFHPSLHAVIDKVVEPFSSWRVIERDALNAWYRKRMLIVGEAAHPMAPLWGQGANMAVEDGAALAVLLRNLSSSFSDADLRERLQLFQQFRKPRTTVIAAVSGTLGGGYEARKEELSQYFEAATAPETDDDLKEWTLGYDVVSEAEKVLAAYVKEDDVNAMCSRV